MKEREKAYSFRRICDSRYLCYLLLLPNFLIYTNNINFYI